MKNRIKWMLAVGLCLSLAACGQSGGEAQSEEPLVQEQDQTEEVTAALQGVWLSDAGDGTFTFYAYQDSNVVTVVLNSGVGAADLLSGTYTVEETQVSYDFGSSTGYSNYTYSEEALALTSATGEEITAVTAADLMEYLTQEEAAGNPAGVVCMADLVITYFPDSDESVAAGEKKAAAEAAAKAEGEAALENLRTTYDKVEKITWYMSKSQPEYTDICCYIYPYIGRADSGATWLRVIANYTDAQTDAGWVFFEKLIFSVDGENTTKMFGYYDVVRDNDTEVWEYVDFEPNASEVALLRSIADSTETIIRFEGDEYYEDHVVTNKEKAAIREVLTAYNYLTNSGG